MLALITKTPSRPVPSNRHLYFILSLPQPSPHRLFLNPFHNRRDLPLDSLDRVLARRERRLRRLLAAVVVPVDVTVPLRQLRELVDQVAAEEEVVLWLDGERVAHERGRIDGQGECHLARDAVRGEGELVTTWEGRERWGTYSSGLFWVSATAARGMPKLETGPQKSGGRGG